MVTLPMVEEYNVVFKTSNLQELKAFVLAREMIPSMTKVWELEGQKKTLEKAIDELEADRRSLEKEIENLKARVATLSTGLKEATLMEVKT